MQYLKFTHTDAVTGVPVSHAAASNGVAFPAVAGLEFVFALESEYPTLAPTMFGTAPDASATDAHGVLAVLTEIEFQQAKDAEDAARRATQLRRMVDAVQQHMDSTAAQRNYDGIQSAALRAALPNSPFHAEGVAYGEWMDACWARCYQIMAEVEAGQRAQPTADELLAELPELVMPA